jgi:ATP-dependent Clp protease ATP-binding subunit ClpB
MLNNAFAYQREKDQASKDRLALARSALAALEDQLQPMKLAYENEKQRGDEVNQVRRKIDELKAKADDAERKYVYPFLPFFFPSLLTLYC